MNILIGSRAMNYWNKSVPINEDTDWDIVSSRPIQGAEFHDRCLLNNDDLYKYVSQEKVQFNEQWVNVLSMKGLSLVKRSHLHRDLSFQKHITHYWKYLEYQRAFWTERDLAFLAERIKMTTERFPQLQPNLNKTVDAFFDDAVVKKYNHDYLHSLYAYEQAPMYTKLQKNSELVWCSKDLWLELSIEQQMQCIAEETYVIATERFLVSADWQYPSKLAYMKSLQKVCTTLCSGYFRDAALDNYPLIVDMYSKDKFQEVQKVLNSKI